MIDKDFWRDRLAGFMIMVLISVVGLGFGYVIMSTIAAVSCASRTTSTKVPPRSSSGGPFFGSEDHLVILRNSTSSVSMQHHPDCPCRNRLAEENQ